MAFTYVGSEIGTSTLYRARFQLGDKTQYGADGTTEIYLLQDDEIEALISLHGYNEGVAQCAESLAIQKANEPDEYEDEGGVKVVWRDRIKAWMALAASLRAAPVPDLGVFSSPRVGVTTGPSDIDDLRFA